MTFPLPIIPGSVICPLTVVTKVFSRVSAREQDSILIDNNGEILTDRAFQRKL